MVNSVSTSVFARSFAQRVPQMAWLLGAGASAAAGVPTGSDLVGDFKKTLYCAAMNISPSEVDLGDPLWSERVDSHFDGQNGFPPTGHPSEYAVAFEAAYPSPSDRRAFIEARAKRGSPSFGHRVLGALIASGRTRCLFTTNFDDLVERAAMAANELVEPERRQPLAVGALDQVERAERCMREGSWPLLVKLHGDFLSERLMNTMDELQCQDEQLRRVLAGVLSQFGLFVIGYSGRDDSVLDVLDEAVGVDGAFSAGLWWAVRPGTAVLPRVESLLEHATAAGIEGGFVESENFDELAGQIERAVDFDEPMREHVLALRPKPLVTPVSLPVSQGTNYPLVRCSALELLELPKEARAVTLRKPLTSAEARTLVKNADVWATVAASGRTVLAFGADDDIERAFAVVGCRLSGTVALDPYADSMHRGLVYDALARSIARRRPLTPLLRGRGHQLLVRPPSSRLSEDAAAEHRRLLGPLRDAYPSPITGNVPRLNCRFAEAIRIRIERHNGRWWLAFEPQTWVDLSDRDGAGRSADWAGSSRRLLSPDQIGAADWRRERWARRYNVQWNNIIDAWSRLIAPDKETVITAYYFKGDGINAAFRISGRTAWSDRNAQNAVSAA